MEQLMNSVSVGHEELSRSRRVLSTEADNTLLDLLNSSYPTKAEFINCLIITLIPGNINLTELSKRD